MSIHVELSDLARTLTDYPWGFLLTVADDGRPRVVAVPTVLADGRLTCNTGDGARRNAVARSNVSLVFPSSTPGGHSLIVDGDAEAADGAVLVTPTHAVLHRPAVTV